MSEPDFEIYAEGLFYASVCSSLGQVETEARMQREFCGTRKGWTLSTEGNFASGEPNPNPCDNYPKTHKHYLFTA